MLLGSAPLLIQQGLTESLAGRFETVRLPLDAFEKAFGPVNRLLLGSQGVPVGEFLRAPLDHSLG